MRGTGKEVSMSIVLLLWAFLVAPRIDQATDPAEIPASSGEVHVMIDGTPPPPIRP
jgi:hypothetical protein